MSKSKLIDKGRKLARLADPSLNDNPAEVANAHDKLKSFLIKNNLTFRDLGLFTLFRKEFIHSSNNLKLWEQQILLQIAHTFGSQVLFYPNSSTYLVGEKASVEAVERLYDYLHKCINKAADDFLDDYNSYYHKTSSRNSYCIGFTFALCINLKKIKRPTNTSSTSDTGTSGTGMTDAEQAWNAMGDIDHTNTVLKDEHGEINNDPIMFEDFSIQDQHAYHIGMSDGEKITLNLLE